MKILRTVNLVFNIAGSYKQNDCMANHVRVYVMFKNRAFLILMYRKKLYISCCCTNTDFSLFRM